MFLDLDIKGEKIAAIDDAKNVVSYRDLCLFKEEFSESIGERTVIFILAQNDVGALAGYVAALSSNIVPLIISSNTDAQLFERLITTYEPSYLWAPVDMETSFIQQPVLTRWGYHLIKTQYQSYSLHQDLSLLLSTSGSTGSPKLVRHSYKNVESNARNVAEFFQLTDTEKPIAMLPIHYTMGLSVITSHLYAGSQILLTGRSLTDGAFWKLVKDEKATSLTGVPYSFEVLQKLRFFKMDLPDLRLITQGGGKLKDELFKVCAEYASTNGKKFIATYGQTEGTARMAYLPAEFALTKTGSIGKAIPSGELYLVDSSGNKIEEVEAEGEMVYKGPNVTMGYAISKQDLSKGDERNGILHTRDIAKRDEDGFYYIIGRITRFLKIYGLRISLDEIEHLIKSKFNTDCVCAGTDDKLMLYITDEKIVKDVKDFIIEKTSLYHGAFEVNFKNHIKRNEAGKVIFNDEGV